jgi:hypothetical protein
MATLSGAYVPLHVTSTPERGHYSPLARGEAPPLTPNQHLFDLAAHFDASATLVPPE